MSDDSTEALHFLIDDTPVTFVGAITRENLRFLKQIDPSIWIYQAKAHEAGLENDDDKQHAAVALRLVYSQALETFFALVGALVQSPTFALGWLTKYKVVELRSVVRKIHEGEPIRRVLTAEARWVEIARVVHEFLPPGRAGYDVGGAFAQMWEQMADGFLEENFEPEYNSFKHGMRGLAGGFSIAVAKEPRTADTLQPLGSAEFGASFIRAMPIGDLKNTFELHHVSRAWRPASFIEGLHLLAMSIRNVASRLLIFAGEPPTSVTFSWPANQDDFAAPWKERPSIGQLVLSERIAPDLIQQTTPDAIRKFYDDAMERAKQAARETPSKRDS